MATHLQMQYFTSKQKLDHERTNLLMLTSRIKDLFYTLFKMLEKNDPVHTLTDRCDIVSIHFIKPKSKFDQSCVMFLPAERTETLCSQQPI